MILLFDMVKGLVVVMLVVYLFFGNMLFVVVVVMIGYCYLIWFGFCGGKGVVMLMGIVFVLYWLFGLIYVVVWFGLFFGLCILLVVGIVVVISMLFVVVVFSWFDFVLLLFGFVVIVVWKYVENIECLMFGIELCIGKLKMFLLSDVLSDWV